MTEPYYQNLQGKEEDLKGLIGKPVELQCARHGQVEKYQTVVRDIEPFWWIEIYVTPKGGIGEELQQTAQEIGHRLTASVRRMFLGKRSAIQHLKLDGEVIYECPFIPDNYDETNIDNVWAIREKMFGAEYDLECREEHKE